MKKKFAKNGSHASRLDILEKEFSDLGLCLKAVNRHYSIVRAALVKLREKQPKRKCREKTFLTDELIAKIRGMSGRGLTHQQISRELNVSLAPISYVLRFLPPEKGGS